MRQESSHPGAGRKRQVDIFIAGAGGRRPVVPVDPDQLAERARQVMSPEAWAYVAGGAGSEATASANHHAFDRWRIVPRMLCGVGPRELGVELFGRRLDLPILLSPIGVLENPPKDEQELVDRDYRILPIREGRATGRIAGGNLTMLASQMGTPWEIETEGAILVLEDIHEAYYRVDRMLTQLGQGGKLAAAAGVVFGYCSDCPTDAPSFSLEEILFDHLEPLGVPAVAGLTFGHIRDQLTLPIGLEATLDGAAGTLTFAEAAVV